MVSVTSNLPKCFICNNKNFYQDVNGIWHPCPKCIPQMPTPPLMPSPWIFPDDLNHKQWTITWTTGAGSKKVKA